jgi:hypothetical protein
MGCPNIVLYLYPSPKSRKKKSTAARQGEESLKSGQKQRALEQFTESVPGLQFLSSFNRKRVVKDVGLTENGDTLNHPVVMDDHGLVLKSMVTCGSLGKCGFD